MAHKMIDVSSYQGKPDWNEVAQDGVKGAILRIRNSKGVDTSFEYNYNTCGKRGLDRGAYRYSYALTVAQAKAEAREVLQTLDGRKLELGVWLDLEWIKQRALGSTKVKQIASAWMKVIRDAGYECNIYCNLDWYRNVCGGLNAKYWIARYPANDKGVVVSRLRPNIGEIGWQYSSKGKITGISGNVDMDEWYGNLYATSSTNKTQNPYRDSGKVLKYNRWLVSVVREDVRWMQWELREAGYQLQIDGKFGAKTDLALRSFQAVYGLKVDGKCGVATRSAMIA